MHFPSENRVPPARLERATNSLGNGRTALSDNGLAWLPSGGVSASVRGNPAKSAELATGLATGPLPRFMGWNGQRGAL